MKVLFVDNAGVLGGAGRSMAELVAALRTREIDVAVAFPGSVPDCTCVEKRYDIPRFRLHRDPLRLAADIPAFLSARVALSRAIRDFKPDIVHANSLQVALALARVWTPKAEKNGAPFFVHVRDLRFPPSVARFVARRCTRLVAISSAVEARLREVLPESLHGRIVRVQNGIDIDGLLARRVERTSARSALGLPVDGRIVGMMAHFAPWKRYDRFAAMAEIIAKNNPSVCFAVAGTDLFGDSSSCQRLFGGKKTGSVPILNEQKTGPVPVSVRLLGDVDNAVFLSAVDCLVHPASGEPFGRSVCEAIAMGVPVVAVDSAGPAEILAVAGRGKLVPDSGDVPAALAEGVRSALAGEVAGGPLSEDAARGLSIGRAADELLALFRQAPRLADCIPCP